MEDSSQQVHIHLHLVHVVFGYTCLLLADIIGSLHHARAMLVESYVLPVVRALRFVKHLGWSNYNLARYPSILVSTNNGGVTSQPFCFIIRRSFAAV